MGHLKVRLIKFAVVGLRGFFIQRLIQHEIRGWLCSLFCHGLSSALGGGGQQYSAVGHTRSSLTVFKF